MSDTVSGAFSWPGPGLKLSYFLFYVEKDFHASCLCLFLPLCVHLCHEVISPRVCSRCVFPSVVRLSTSVSHSCVSSVFLLLLPVSLEFCSNFFVVLFRFFFLYPESIISLHFSVILLKLALCGFNLPWSVRFGSCLLKPDVTRARYIPKDW